MNIIDLHFTNEPEANYELVRRFIQTFHDTVKKHGLKNVSGYYVSLLQQCAGLDETILSVQGKTTLMTDLGIKYGDSFDFIKDYTLNELKIMFSQAKTSPHLSNNIESVLMEFMGKLPVAPPVTLLEFFNAPKDQTHFRVCGRCVSEFGAKRTEVLNMDLNETVVKCSNIKKLQPIEFTVKKPAMEDFDKCNKYMQALRSHIPT